VFNILSRKKSDCKGREGRKEINSGPLGRERNFWMLKLYFYWKISYIQLSSGGMDESE
jgi:hypothetical protein